MLRVRAGAQGLRREDRTSLLVEPDGRVRVEQRNVAQVSIETYPADIEQVRQTLGLGDVVVIGHSVHGVIALGGYEHRPTLTALASTPASHIVVCASRLRLGSPSVRYRSSRRSAAFSNLGDPALRTGTCAEPTLRRSPVPRPPFR